MYATAAFVPSHHINVQDAECSQHGGTCTISASICQSCCKVLAPVAMLCYFNKGTCAADVHAPFFVAASMVGVA